MKLTDTEWTLMTRLWDRNPLTAREIAEDLPADNKWAYTTIKTLLNRLVDKGALSETKRGNTSIYEPLIARRDARRTAVRSLLDKAFGGSMVISCTLPLPSGTGA